MPSASPMESSGSAICKLRVGADGRETRAAQRVNVLAASGLRGASSCACVTGVRVLVWVVG